jgi:hypothetical protein
VKISFWTVLKSCKFYIALVYNMYWTKCHSENSQAWEPNYLHNCFHAMYSLTSIFKWNVHELVSKLKINQSEILRPPVACGTQNIVLRYEGIGSILCMKYRKKVMFLSKYSLDRNITIFRCFVHNIPPDIFVAEHYVLRNTILTGGLRISAQVKRYRTITECGSCRA